MTQTTRMANAAPSILIAMTLLIFAHFALGNGRWTSARFDEIMRYFGPSMRRTPF